MKLEKNCEVAKKLVIGKESLIFIFLLVGILGGCAAVESDPIALEKESFKSAAIDTHVHAGRWDPNDYLPWMPSVVLDGSVEKAVEQLALTMEEARVEMVLLMGDNQDWNVKGDPLGIKRCLKVAEALSILEKPLQSKIIGAVDPSKGLNKTEMQAVKDQLDKHRDVIVSLKCYLGYHGDPMDPGYQPFYKLALDCNLPVIFHTGDTASNKTDLTKAHPLRVDEVARKYPKMRIVMAHMGNPWFTEAALTAWRHPNVWVDVSGWYVGSPKVLDEMVQSGLQTIPGGGFIMSDIIKALTFMNKYDRILYGSDYPIVQMSSYRRFIEAVIPKEHHEKVFRKNAEELFGFNLNVPTLKASLNK
ncbi:amidohydrolase family protein [Planctomycetota bacterium]